MTVAVSYECCRMSSRRWRRLVVGTGTTWTVGDGVATWWRTLELKKIILFLDLSCHSEKIFVLHHLSQWIWKGRKRVICLVEARQNYDSAVEELLMMTGTGIQSNERECKDEGNGNVALTNICITIFFFYNISKH